MIAALRREDGDTLLRVVRGAPVVGPLCEMHWRLLGENPKLPHRFYTVGNAAVLKVAGDGAMLCGAPEDEEELLAFLRFGGIAELTALDYAPAGWRIQEDNVVMVRPGDVDAEEAAGVQAYAVDGESGFAGTLHGADTFYGEAAMPRAQAAGLRFDAAPAADAVLDVLESSRGRMQEDVREGFWTELNIRRNHGAALVCGLWDGEALASTAGAYAVTAGAAYIACVETRPGMRGKGCAGALLEWLCGQLAGWELSLFCGEALAGYYERFGFARAACRGVVAARPETE